MIPFRLLVIMIVGSLCLTSCNRVKPPEILPITEVHQKFIDLCKTDYHLEVLLKPLANTLWIYIPTTEPIVDYKATPKSPDAQKEPKEKYTVKFLETSYHDHNFYIDYDIQKTKTYPPKDLGVGSDYSEKFSAINRNIFTAIMRSYFDVNPNEGASESQVDKAISENHLPQFFVVTIANIERGVKLEFTFTLDDFKKQAIGYLPYEEFSQRMIYEMSGDESMINDKTGEHLNVHEIDLSDFLAKQIANRINFKYGRSDFPPSSDTKAELLYHVNQAVDAYNFTDFDAVSLHDLADTTTEVVPKSDLAKYKEMPTPSEGTLHTIKFF